MIDKIEPFLICLFMGSASFVMISLGILIWVKILNG